MDQGEPPPLELMRDLEYEGKLSLIEVSRSVSEVVFTSHPHDRCPVCGTSTRVCPRHSRSRRDDEFCIWCFADRHRTATVISSNMSGSCDHCFHRPCLLLWALYLRHFRETVACPLVDCRTHFKEALIYREVKEKSVLMWIPDDLPNLRAGFIENAIQDLRLARYHAGFDPEENDQDLLFQMQLKFRLARNDSSLLENEISQEDDFSDTQPSEGSGRPGLEKDLDVDFEDGGDETGIGIAKEFLGAVNWGTTDGAEVTASGYDAVIRLEKDGDVVIAAPGDEIMDSDE